MGIYFEPGGASWSYSGFYNFRKKICELAGMEWPEFPVKDEKENIRRWEIIKKSKDPIKYLLCHSDCDGTIGPTRLKKLLPRLRHYVCAMKKEGTEKYDFGYDWEQGNKLICGIGIAIDKNKPLKFC